MKEKPYVKVAMYALNIILQLLLLFLLSTVSMLV